MPEQSSAWSQGNPPAIFEKLWRGLILIAAIHLGGMTINLIAQMLGYNGLDGIPAKFLGL